MLKGINGFFFINIIVLSLYFLEKSIQKYFILLEKVCKNTLYF